MLRRPCILVVDDEPDILALVTYYLGARAYRVRAATDGVEALESIASDSPDLVVLDLMLPGMTGWDILRELRRRPGGETLPVVLLTARHNEEDRTMASHFGAADYITKPFSPRQLVQRIETVLQRVSRDGREPVPDSRRPGEPSVTDDEPEQPVGFENR